MFLFESLSDLRSEWTKSNANAVKRFFLSLFGYSGSDFENYNFKELSVFKIIAEFIPYYRRKTIRGNNQSPSAAILRDKHETLRMLVAHGLPTSKPRYLIEDSIVYLLDNELVKSMVASKITKGTYVIKPTNQRWGKGVEFIDAIEDIATEDCLELRNAMRNNYSTMIIEEREENHPLLNELSKTSLNTIRIVTVKSVKGEIETIFACVRFSDQECRVDNWASGGFAANVDLNTGILNVARKKEITDTAVIDFTSRNFSVPYFVDAKNIAEKAHAIFPDMKSIGWDIAITPHGAIIIEGNDDWDVVMPQKLMQKGIKRLIR